MASLLALGAAIAMFFLVPSDESDQPTPTTTTNSTSNAASSDPSTISNLVDTGDTTTDSVEISFDGCGQIPTYSDAEQYPWFQTLNEKYEAETGKALFNYQPGSIEGYYDANEGCYSANGDMFIFIKENGYGEASTIYKYEINNDVLAKATLDGNDQQFHASSKGFGQREGQVIHLEPALTGDAGTCAEFMYDYNFVTNVQSYVSQKAVPCS